jgi:hypothetical protein
MDAPKRLPVRCRGPADGKRDVAFDQECLDSRLAAHIRREPDDGNAIVGAVFVKRLQGGHLEFARAAPSGPEIHDDDFAREIFGGNEPAIECGQFISRDPTLVWAYSGESAELRPKPVGNKHQQAERHETFAPYKETPVFRFLRLS